MDKLWTWIHDRTGCWPFWYCWHRIGGTYKHRRCTVCGREQFNYINSGWSDELPDWMKKQTDHDR